MKIALACDWLTTPGGAEKVLLKLHQMYPDAPIYTSQYDKKGINWFDDADVRTGWLQIFPSNLRKFLGPLRQLYFSHLDLSAYDVVISVTGAEAKSIRTHAKSPARGFFSRRSRKHGSEPSKKPGVKTKSCTLSSHYSTHGQKSQEGKSQSSRSSQSSALHLCYCHVPTQYYWQFYDQYMTNPGFGILNPLVKLCFWLLVKPLRQLDFQAASQVDQFVTISHYAKDLIQEYYQRSAVVVAPPVDLQTFSKVQSRASSSGSQLKTQQESQHEAQQDLHTSDPKKQQGKRQGFIISCRQVTWKRVDLAILACLEAGVPLRVVGDGPEHQRLQQLAAGSPLITFYKWVDSQTLAHLLQTSAAYIFPSLEPFGIAAVEALAAGCPVLAYAGGGSRDFVVPHQNGLLFSEQSVASLVDAIQEFDPAKFSTSVIQRSAKNFSESVFEAKIQDLVSQAMQEISSCS